MNFTIIIFLILFISTRFALSQSTPEEIFSKGLENFNTANFPDAIKYLDEYIESSPNDSKAYNYRGLCYQALKDYPRAIEDFTKVISLGKSNLEGYINRGNTYLLEKVYSAAITDFTDAINIDQQNIESYIGRSRAHATLENFPSAIADLNSASGIDPKNAKVYINKAWVHILAKDTSKVFDDISTALLYDSNLVFTDLKRDLLYLKVENFMNALQIANDDVKMYPGSYLSYFIRGFVFYMLNKGENALDDLRSSLKFNTNEDLKYIDIVNKLIRIIERDAAKDFIY